MESIYAGRGLSRSSDDKIAEINAMRDRRMEALRAYAEQQKALQEELLGQGVVVNNDGTVTQVVQQPQQQVANYNPMQDPEGNFAKYLASMNTGINQVFAKSSIEREREYVMPYLEKQWQEVAMPKLVNQGVTGAALNRAKAEYMQKGRVMAGADFSDRQSQTGWAEHGGALLNAGARGVVGLVDAGSGLVKTVFGDDNFVSGFVDGVTQDAKDALKEWNNAEQQELTEYFMSLAARGEYAKMAKLIADYPKLGLEQIAEQIAPLGAWGKGAKALAGGRAAAGSKVAQAVTSPVGNIMSYTAFQMGGGMAQELSRAGIDPNSPGGIFAVALTGLGGAAISTLPGTMERTILQNFLGRGLSENTSKVLTQQVLEKLKAGGWFRSTVRYGAGLAKNAAKGGAAEGVEEGLQSGLEGFAKLLANPDGTVRNLSDNPITDEEWAGISKRAATGATMGSMLGAGTRAISNGFNRFADNEKSRLYKDNLHYQNMANQGQYVAPQAADTNKATKELKDLADRRAVEIAEKEAKEAFEKQIKDTYKDSAETALADHNANINAATVTTEIEDILNSVVGVNSNVPADTAEAYKYLNQVTDADAKATMLADWANFAGRSDLEDRAKQIPSKLAQGYEFDTSGNYTNTRAMSDASDTVKTALESVTQKPVQDIDTEMESYRHVSKRVSNLIDEYKQAVTDGYAKTAKEIADKFATEMGKYINSPAYKQQQQQQQTPTISDTVRQSMLNNSQDIGVITGAIYGQGYWASKKTKTAFKTDPDAFLDDLIMSVAGVNPTVLDKTDIAAVTKELQAARTAWANDQDYTINIDPAILAKLNKVK